MSSGSDSSGMNLNAMQRWFMEQLMAPYRTPHRAPTEVPTPEVAADRVVKPSATLTPQERMTIYAQQYMWRFQSVSKNTHAALAAVMGEGDFDQLIIDYLSRFPPYGFTLNNLCQALPHYLEHYCQRADKGLLLDLARLERAVSDAYDTYRVGTVTADDLTALPQEAFGLLRFRLDPSVRVLAFEHNVMAIYDANIEGEPLPEGTATPTWGVVWRYQHKVWRQSISHARYQILAALNDGQTVMSALERAAAVWDGDIDQLASQLFGWFNEWVEEEFFCSVIAPTT